MLVPNSQPVFTTVAGSRLYGMSHDDSDYDTFTVVTGRRRKGRHHVNGDQDRVVVTLPRFLDLVTSGSHQSVEALFSPYKEWNPQYESLRPFLESYRITGPEVFAKYERTIKSFCYGDFKRRRHAVRLMWGLSQLRDRGFLVPVLRPQEVEYATILAETLEGEELWTLLITQEV